MEWYIGSAIGFILICLLCWRFYGNKNKTFGSARWASPFTAFAAGLFGGHGLRVGEWTGRLSVFYNSTHALTFGVSGSGKGTSAILPNLLSLPYVFLIDPGGENTAIAAKSWRDRGLQLGCINLFGMFDGAPWALPAHGFNPLDFLDPHSQTFAADALLFAEMLTPRAGNESGSSSYFKDSAQNAKRAMIVHIKTTEPHADQHLATLYNYVNRDAAGWENLLAAMKANPVCGGLVAQEAIKLERIEGQAPEEFSAIMSTIQQDLSFLADPLVRDKLSRSDVNFEILKGIGKGQKGGIISVVLPLEYMESHAAIPRLAMACAVLELQRAPLATRKVVFLIDEAAALGKILRFPNWLATLRKYRVAIWSIWQNIGQVEHLYDKNWQGIISNCGCLQILGVGDVQTAEYTEKLLGKCTVLSKSRNGRGDVSHSQVQRSLVMADELFRLDHDRQIAFIGNLHPLLLRKVPYWKRPELIGSFHPNPYFGGNAPDLSAIDQLKTLWGKFFYVLLWWMTPHPIAGCIITLPLALYLLHLYLG